MAEDYRLWRFLSFSNKRGIPVMAVIFQSLISIVLILTGTFEQILIYCGFLLNFFSGITVAGSFIARRKGLSPKTFKTPLFPLPQLIFLILSLWIMVYLIIQQPMESLFGLINIIIGLTSYLLSKKMKNEI
jgi:APA family basic amino acid/polyamine antiporter